MTDETWPGSTVQTDEQWEDWLRGQVFTEYHPSSTCAMLPLAQGGVVDGNLRVHGIANVRVADASVPPILFSSHLMSSTYGIAEQASSIIREYYNQKAPKKSKPQSTSSKTKTEDPKTSPTKALSSPKTTATQENIGAMPLRPWLIFPAAAALLALQFSL